MLGLDQRPWLFSPFSKELLAKLEERVSDRGLKSECFECFETSFASCGISKYIIDRVLGFYTSQGTAHCTSVLH